MITFLPYYLFYDLLHKSYLLLHYGECIATMLVKTSKLIFTPFELSLSLAATAKTEPIKY